jgi:hypothetical protein
MSRLENILDLYQGLINKKYNNMNTFKSLMFLTLFLSFAVISNAQDHKNPQVSPKKKIATTNNMQSQQPRITTSTRPISKSSMNGSKPAISNNSTIIGEGKYLSYTKKIMEVSVTGEIPEGFPKHIKGQSEEQYIQVMKTWAKNNLNQIKEEYRAEVTQ